MEKTLIGVKYMGIFFSEHDSLYAQSLMPKPLPAYIMKKEDSVLLIPNKKSENIPYPSTVQKAFNKRVSSTYGRYKCVFKDGTIKTVDRFVDTETSKIEVLNKTVISFVKKKYKLLGSIYELEGIEEVYECNNGYNKKPVLGDTISIYLDEVCICKATIINKIEITNYSEKVNDKNERIIKSSIEKSSLSGLFIPIEMELNGRLRLEINGKTLLILESAINILQNKIYFK